MYWYLKVLRQYADFSGRASRREYWMFVLINTIILIILEFIDFKMGTLSNGIEVGFLSGIYSLAVFIPSLAVSIRRLHDVGKSGWFLLISLIPVIGSIWLLILYIKDSAPGNNVFGPNPNETT
ncbi:DUF805 domain-containing protein [candidate division TA06 bacterium]|jgi:uncharacterized membrane protein YhaH (DUF805 family)|uniref:DUF805 domain-containing protein n=1 Tax=candidate division TA06 bacterium TaxID=2250710 RepID=A0A660S8R2_UNCT6|nr:MAG: DUF805 domain-containing protein [candidate division TA06 bacterium]